MKKFILLVVISITILVSNAQNRFIDYFVVPDYSTNTDNSQADNTPTQRVYGYFSTSNGWVRIELKIKETDNSVLVVGYKQKDTSRFGGAFVSFGNSNHWRNCREWASEVSVYSDGREIGNSFSYKAHISGLGTVYF